MGRSKGKSNGGKKGRDSSPLKKATPSPTSPKARKRKKKNKQGVKNLGNDSPAIQSHRKVIDFSRFAAGSTGSGSSTGAASLSSIPEQEEDIERAVTPTCDNRQQAATSNVAQMNEEQRKSFVPINQSFGKQDTEESGAADDKGDEDGSETPLDQSQEVGSTQENEVEELTEEEDSKTPDESTPVQESRAALKQAPSPAAHNPYAVATPMELDRTGEWDLNAGPLDATIPRTVFRNILRRVEIKVTTQGSTQSDVELVNGIKAIMAKLQEADKTIIVLPYGAAHSDLKPLKRFPQDIPSGIGTLKKYFQNATPRMNGGSYYIRALLCFNKPFEEFTEDIKWWLGENQAGIWIRRVQEEKVTRLGWLLYSLRSMDIERLTRVYSYRYGTKVGIRYATINTGRRGKYDPDVQLPKAIHIEVAETQAARVSAMITKDYSSNQTDFPMGTKMRFVPDLNQLMNFSTRAKSLQLATRQMAFEDKMAYGNSWEISDLYSLQPQNGNKCLADLITSISSTTLPHLKTIHSVTKGYQTGTTTFAFIPQLEQEARTLIAALLPYLRSQYGDSMFKYFTSVAGDRALACTWDPVTNQVISPGDEAVENATLLDEDFHFEEDSNQVVIVLPTTPAAPAGGTAAFAKETDSVSTLQQHSKKSSRRKTPREPVAPQPATAQTAPQRASPKQVPKDSDDRSAQSTASALTMETLETTVQSVVQEIFDNQLGDIIQRAITQSMHHMHGLAVSAKSQQESEVQQKPVNSSGTSHQHTADDETHSGSPSGASANG